MKIRRAEPICIKDFWGHVIIIYHFSQVMLVVVRSLVEVLLLMENLWLSGHLIRIVAEQCIYLHCRVKHGRRRKKYQQVMGHQMKLWGEVFPLSEMCF